MAAPYTPNLTAAQEAVLSQELNTYFNGMQTLAILKCLSYLAGGIPAAGLTTQGSVKKAATVAAITPAADGTTAGTALNAILVAIKAAGIMA